MFIGIIIGHLDTKTIVGGGPEGERGNRLSQSLTHVRANIKHYYLISQLYNYYNTIHFILVILKTRIFSLSINVLYMKCPLYKMS